MERTFGSCKRLISIDLSKFDTSSVTTFEEMFHRCEIIKSIDASCFKATNAKNINEMFSYDYKLISINLANFNTSNVEYMKGVFYKNVNLKYLNLQHFSDNLVNETSSLFNLCSQLLYLNLRSFITANPNNQNVLNAFSVHPNDIKYCIEDSNTKNILIGNKTNDCSDFCFQSNVIFDIEKGVCGCNQNYKFEFNNNCYQERPASTFPIFEKKYMVCLN